MDVSTRRAKNGIAANVNGTQAAVVPMDVPTTIRVNGMMATIKMINGMERVALTIAPRILLSAAFSKICPLEVTTNTTPSGIPIIMAITVEITVICNVSKVPVINNLITCSDITDHLAFNW